MPDIRVLVLGCGSIGSRHARNLARFGGVEIFLFDPAPGRAPALAAEIGARFVETLAEGLSMSPQATVICTPPDRHLEHMQMSIEANADVFVEKPLAIHADDTLMALLDEADRRRRSIMVGYNLRFNPCVQEVKRIVAGGTVGEVLAVDAEFGQYLPDWRPGTDYRVGYITRASSDGGGIIRDVASHELDYITWIVGDVSLLGCIATSSGSLEMESEDVAEITLQFGNRAVGRVHVDCLQRQYTRRLKIVGTHGTVEWDRFKGTTLRGSENDALPELVHPAVDLSEAYTLEMEHFLRVIAGDARPAVSGREAFKTLRLVELALESAATGRAVRVD